MPFAPQHEVDGAVALEMDVIMWRELGAELLQPARIVSELRKLCRMHRNAAAEEDGYDSADTADLDWGQFPQPLSV